MTSHPLRNIIISILLITASSLARAEERLVFSGNPTVKVESAPQASNRVELTTQEQTEYRVLITTRDGKYYWASRENKELFHFRSGAFDWFVAPGSGYIKVVDRRYLLQEDGPRYSIHGAYDVTSEHDHLLGRWRTFSTMTPNKPLQPTPYSLRFASAFRRG